MFLGRHPGANSRHHKNKRVSVCRGLSTADRLPSPAAAEHPAGQQSDTARPRGIAASVPWGKWSPPSGTAASATWQACWQAVSTFSTERTDGICWGERGQIRAGGYGFLHGKDAHAQPFIHILPAASFHLGQALLSPEPCPGVRSPNQCQLQFPLLPWYGRTTRLRCTPACHPIPRAATASARGSSTVFPPAAPERRTPPPQGK